MEKGRSKALREGERELRLEKESKTAFKGDRRKGTAEKKKDELCSKQAGEADKEGKKEGIRESFSDCE